MALFTEMITNLRHGGGAAAPGASAAAAAAAVAVAATATMASSVLQLAVPCGG